MFIALFPYVSAEMTLVVWFRTFEDRTVMRLYLFYYSYINRFHFRLMNPFKNILLETRY